MKLTHKYGLLLVVFIVVAMGSPGKIEAEEIDFDNIDMDSSAFDAASAAFKKSIDPYFCTVDKITDPATLNGLSLLQKDLYTHSNLVVSRSIHDMPLFMQTNAGKRCDYDFGIEIDPFYNQTKYMCFVGSSTDIKSYVDFSSTGLLGEAASKVKEFMSDQASKTFNIEEILPLFSNITLEERRAGLYIRLSAYLKNWTFQFAVPVYYQERNFFISEEDQKKIKNVSFLSEQSTGMSEDTAQAIMMKHIVSDKIGLGDMRVHLLYTPYQDDDTRCTVGGFVTLPTAFAFKNGLMGGSFYKHNYIPPFSLEQAFSIICEPDQTVDKNIAVKNSGINYGLRALDHLTEILAETSLGNNGHVGIAPIIECDHIFTRCDNVAIGLAAQASLQGFLPCSEKRAYLVENVPSDFNTRNYKDKDLAKENVAFLDTQLNNILFPTIIDTRVTPGLIFEGNAAFHYDYSECLKAQIGYDFWCRGDESIAMSSAVNGKYDISASKTASAWQQKVFGSIETYFPFCGGDLTTRFGGDVTVASKNIGKDFTVNVLLQLSY